MSDVRQTLPNWPRLMRAAQAAQYLSISETSLRERGPQPKEFGRARLYDVRDLDRWADALAGQPLDPIQREDEGDDIHRRVLERMNANGKN